MDTIFAEATPPGRGGVSVVRISGPRAREVIETLTGPLPVARHAYLRALRDSDDLLDRALVLWFEKHQSFTGEEVAELQLHGAPVVVTRVSQALLDRGLRRAEAGEFTRRAFLNGQIDLAEAEGLADLLAAETETQRRLAMRVAEGQIGFVADEFRRKLIRAGALVEASIDFADEEVPEEVPAEAFELVKGVQTTIQELLRTYPATERMRQGYVVAIIGPPNAGKSTLLNRIAGREIALVSEIAGTTRDVIEVRLDLNGLAVTLLDTAGIRESQDPVEMMGVARARQRAREADLRIHLSETAERQDDFQDGDLVVRSKSDLTTEDLPDSVSALSGKGVDALLDQVYDLLRDRVIDSGLISHRRQADALGRAWSALDLNEKIPAELMAESIRRANHELALLVGRVGAEDYLDEIFSSFCIGK